MNAQKSLTISALSNLLAINTEITLAKERNCLELLPKFLGGQCDRIGHLMTEIDYIIKNHHLNSDSHCSESTATIARVLYDPLTICNKASLSIFPKQIEFIECAFPNLLRPKLEEYGLLIPPCDVLISSSESISSYHAQQAAWGNRAPVVSIPNEWIEKGEQALQALGLPSGAQYVCIHARDGGYSPNDEQYHFLRNTDIRDYDLSISFLTAKGYWIIRMGNPTMPPATANAMLIDYAHSQMRQDWLDIYISANCSFFLTDASGCAHMSSVFSRPIAYVNGAMPFSFSFSGAASQIGIPKLFKSIDRDQFVSFKEVFGSNLGGLRFSHELERMGLRLVNNTPEEILDVAIEVDQLISGKRIYSAADLTRQLYVHSLIPKEHLIYGCQSLCGRAFLEKYEYLF